MSALDPGELADAEPNGPDLLDSSQTARWIEAREPAVTRCWNATGWCHALGPLAPRLSICARRRTREDGRALVTTLRLLASLIDRELDGAAWPRAWSRAV